MGKTIVIMFPILLGQSDREFHYMICLSIRTSAILGYNSRASWVAGGIRYASMNLVEEGCGVVEDVSECLFCSGSAISELCVLSMLNACLLLLIA